MRRNLLAVAIAGVAWPPTHGIAQQSPPAELAALFGPAVAAHPLTKAPFAELDLDGDGKPDRVWVVRLTRGGADALAKETRRANPLGKRGLGGRGEPVAVAIAHASGERWLVHDGEFFATPIW